MVLVFLSTTNSSIFDLIKKQTSMDVKIDDHGVNVLLSNPHSGHTNAPALTLHIEEEETEDAFLAIFTPVKRLNAN